MAVGSATRIALCEMTREDIRAVRRIESAAYADAWPSRVFETELANAFARYRVAVERPMQPAAAGTTSAGECAPHRHARGGPLAPLRRLLGGGEAERIVGFMGVWYMVDQLHLVTIAVAPRAQGRGIGQRMLEACVDMAIDAEFASIVLEVRVSNDRAHALYERYGFKRTGTLRAYYRDDNEDAYVMLCESLHDPDTRARFEELRAQHRARFGDHFE